MVNTPSDRVQVRRLGELMPPGACALCGNGTCLEGYVDLDIFYDYEGQVYLCMNCARDVAKTIGCLLPGESTHLENLNRDVAAELKETQEKLAHAQSRLDAYDSVISGAFANPVTRTGTNVQSAAQPSSDVKPPVGTGAGESEPKKSVTRKRPNDVTRSASSDEPAFHV